MRKEVTNCDECFVAMLPQRMIIVSLRVRAHRHRVVVTFRRLPHITVKLLV